MRKSWRLAPWLAGVLGAVTLIAGCGVAGMASGANSVIQPTTQQSAATKSAAPSPITFRDLRFHRQGSLPVGVVGNVLASDSGGHVYSAGGYTGAESIKGVYEISPSIRWTANLPSRTHDAAAGFLGGNLYVFGGGQSNSYDTIVRIHGSSATVVGRMSRAVSDAVSVAYTYRGMPGLLLIGGYDGRTYFQGVSFVHLSGGNLQWIHLFQLPTGLRYPAVAVHGTQVYIAGGKTPTGLSDKILSWAPGWTGVKSIGKLPHGLEKAAAFAGRDHVFIMGGLMASGSPSAAVFALDVNKRHLSTLGNLPTPLADLGYATTATGRGFLAGGMISPNGKGTSGIYSFQIPSGA